MKANLLLLLLALTTSSGTRAAPVPPEQPRPVRVLPAQLSDQARPVEASGVVARRAEVDLAFAAPGVVEEVAVRVGDVVTRGQVLARLHLDEVEARLSQARAGLAKAQRDVVRAQELVDSGTVSTETVQNARTELAVAEAAVQAADFLRRHAVLEAPADGRILRRWVEPEQVVAAGTPVLGFADDEAGWLVRLALSAREVSRLAVGDHALITPSGLTEQSFTAVVARISAGAETPARTTEVELVPEGPVPASLRSGFVVHARLQPAPVAPRSVVPAAALVEGQGDHAGLFIVSAADSTVTRVEVEVEALDGESAYLRTALPTHALVVIAGAELLRAGESVRMVTADQTTPATP